MALKENQPHLLEDVHCLFSWAESRGYEAIVHAHHTGTHKGHRRIEIRECWAISNPSCIAKLTSGEEWAQLRTVVRVQAERRVGATRTTEALYYLSSLPVEGARTAEWALEVVRSHLGIENCFHWVRDMASREDQSRVRKDHGDENLAVLRHTALNLLCRDTKTRLGIHGKRLKAGWDTDYHSRLITSGMRYPYRRWAPSGRPTSLDRWADRRRCAQSELRNRRGKKPVPDLLNTGND